MKSKYILLFFLIASATSFPQKKQLTLNDIFVSNKFVPEEIDNARWKPDGSAFAFTKLREDSLQDIYLYNISTLQEELFLSAIKLSYNGKQIKISSYEWTNDGLKLIIRGPEKSIWRHSRMSTAYIYYLKSGNLVALANEHLGLKNVKLSPNGDYVGYVKEHNLFMVELSTGKERQLTFDGTPNILNGEFDWAYEEEFSISDGWQWSPDGNKIAYWKFDQTRVKEFYLIDEMTTYNRIIPLKYPKVGEQNSIVKIAVFDIKSGETKIMDTGDEDDIYLPRIYWADSSGQLFILRLNRRQNKLDLLIANTETSNTETILTETDSCWVDIADEQLIPIIEKNEFLWVSEKSGYRHIYLYDYSGNLIIQITSGNWEVTSLRGYSEDDKIIYFCGKKDGIINQHIYSVYIDGKKIFRISKKSGWHAANFSPEYNYFIHNYNSVEVPLKVYLRRSNGEQISILRENKFPALKEYDLITPQLEEFITRDGTVLNYMITYPKDFDPSQKYPVLIYGYGGPGSQNAINRWRGKRQLWHQMMAEMGFIIYTMDNRGTGGRGKSFKNLMYRDLSKWVVNDHIEAAKFLATLPYIDTDRIGVWGWSGGGTLTIWLLTRANDYFKCGVSVAPNTDFRLYDAIWSERYMDLLENNEEGYERAAPLTYALNLKGNLLLIHGTEDDNVHYQHTMQLVKKLQDAGKQFELMLYPNKNHSIKGESIQKQLHELMQNFFLLNL